MNNPDEVNAEDLEAAELVVRTLRDACGDETPEVLQALRGDLEAQALGARARAVHDALAPLGREISRPAPAYLQYGCMVLFATGIVFAIIGALTVVRFLWPD